ncbi:DUF1667 domain-containing protein [Pseudoramibacter sp.]|jgi:CxxC motif-containing protein|uniref:DUF1667 domain-containing protein n=1 Tax=Pseudoramibacter sp. TaxID=2034862 RepID=UPI0025F1156A|nr:DUF1667 domain-containing protein [Pseudoramibacter sp.]MCH4072386.1 DUF1667 domain-containing protein [Pseudoramibacter sp.]MCH4106157.1 DUF1667 domain-containing protein [Pseudoramibacter sp.]
MKKIKMSCTTCPNSCELLATVENDQVVAVEGNLCKRGVDFAESEYRCPVRVLTSTMILDTGAKAVMVPVRSAKPIPKAAMQDAMKAIAATHLHHAVKMGEALIKNVADTGVDIVASKTVLM